MKTAEETDKLAEEAYELSISDEAIADGCLESVARWNTPAFKDLSEEDKAGWRQSIA